MATSNLRWVRSGIFWQWCLPTLLLASVFFAWELKLIAIPFLPVLPRVPTTTFDVLYSAVLALLLGLSAGLFGWQRRFGACPVGARRTAGLAGFLGGIALLCPVCLVLPASFLGLGAFFVLLGPFLPLVRLLAFVFACVAVYLLWPRGSTGSP